MQALILVIISTVLTMLGGHIPARMAAKKDAAIALRSEQIYKDFNIEILIFFALNLPRKSYELILIFY